MRLNIYKNYLSLITDFEAYCKYINVLVAIFYGIKEKILCATAILYSYSPRNYPGGVYHNSQTIYEKLESIGVDIPFNDRHYPYYACFDFEYYFSQEHLPKNGKKLIFEAYHFPMSVGIASCIRGYEQPVCYV